ncbi:monovalent cation/proton antiporter, MnhG/PhaG subunit [Rubrobacter radiotolerans]|uniref:Monovalent cation/H(+) antiporter subunit G n=1 Tax=Rubrobacter radiotolerans TaxID=42256 RepID=A0A023X1B7_RUBRA|nr:monovalent cation/H(+) antiporter subunit G [Rubrobacter radiotolerans]AHY46267.1 monovalent cation/proton antiporter, MnhG/PhaG subunit [Rubrobacter radiotolerans]MDX5893675.1 monovalent cation/H(+) antiporter subunit G [Rubrobacter radiotolerans]SMC04251.1 multicomponent Na+:H+ antiporter subunit G [Rubrobacter radiotolerans DSM 5868]
MSVALILDGATVLLVLAGAFFFLAGTVGLLRFPDSYTRLHSLTKADNTGLGLVVVGLMLQAPTVLFALKMVFVWFLVLVSGAVAAHLISSTALKSGYRPWREK